jgi:hypothetical protein
MAEQCLRMVRPLNEPTESTAGATISTRRTSLKYLESSIKT